MPEEVGKLTRMFCWEQEGEGLTQVGGSYNKVDGRLGE